MSTINVGPGVTSVTFTRLACVSVPVAELQALRATVRELVALADALQPAPGTRLLVGSVQGLARTVAARLENIG